MISEAARDRLFFYSPLSFLRGSEASVSHHMLASLSADVDAGSVKRHGGEARVWLRHLEWDSAHFDCPMYRVEFVDWDENVSFPVAALSRTLGSLRESLSRQHGRYYLFAEFPPEDVVAVQAAGTASLRLVETRLTYMHDGLDKISSRALASIREATSGDLENVKATAVLARNDFDRYHADPFYGQAAADAYVSAYAGQCVNGLADVVLVPADSAAPGAFVCGKVNIPSPNSLRVGRLVLAAVGPTRRGWYRSLNEALLRWMHVQGMSLVLNTTQATNRAVIHVSTQLGYRFARSTHIFACSDDRPA